MQGILTNDFKNRRKHVPSYLVYLKNASNTSDRIKP